MQNEFKNGYREVECTCCSGAGVVEVVWDRATDLGVHYTEDSYGQCPACDGMGFWRISEQNLLRDAQCIAEAASVTFECLD